MLHIVMNARVCVCVCRQLPLFPIYIEGKAIMQPRTERKEDSLIDQLKSYEKNEGIIKIQAKFKTLSQTQNPKHIISSDKASYPK